MANLVNILGSAFDASTIDPNSGGNNLPVSFPDSLLVTITESDMKPAKTEGNYYVEFVIEVIEGPATGDRGVLRLNLINSNAVAVRIAQKELSALCRVCGVWSIESTEQLHGIPFRVVTVEKPYTGSDGKEYKGSEIKKILDENGNPPVSDGGSNAAKTSAPSTNKPSFTNTAAPQWTANKPTSAPDSHEAPPWGKK